MVTNTDDSTTITFDLEENTLNELEKKAENDGISLDTLINEILMKHTELDTSESQSRIVSVDKPTVTKIFEKMSREEVVELATHVGKDATTEAILFMKSKIDLDSYLSWLELYMRNSSLEITHNIEGNDHTIIIKHDLGENWSLYQKTIVESIFNEVLRKPVGIIMVSKTTLTFKFEGMLHISRILKVLN
jgi:predicted DNA-binding ribbon-helix-helix protein